MSGLPSAASPHSPVLEASLALLPGPERILLTRLAPLTSFDELITAEVRRGIGSGNVATLTDLAEYRFVLAVRDRPGRFRIRDDMRRMLLDSWGEGQPSGTAPTELATFCERLAERLNRGQAADPTEVLSLRLFANPPAALAEWKALYAEADRRFDLARCRSLISMLGWTATVSREVDAVREDYGTYLDTRGHWTGEWYQTGPFVLPAASHERFESLLRGDRGRVLELQGSAGFGKTMHLRWLIARRCVPADVRIPCAYIDFDTVDPFAATRDPYLVLLEMADQLDRQLPGDAFGKLIRTYAADRALLYRRQPTAATRPPDIRDSAEAKARSAAAEDVLRRFCGRLAEIPADQPVMLILDTFEVPVHLPDTPRGTAAKPLLAALAAAARAESVRLVLAGRYEIPGDIKKLFPRWCEPFKLPKFTKDEARTYLVGKRHVEREEYVAAAIQAADGVPFSLALLADLIKEDPGISPGKIAEYHGAEYAYLIEKVVKRIHEQPVRWVLRYAAIPRRFDYEFVRAVIWPRARAEMRGEGGLDNPADDDIPQEDRVKTWAVGPETAAAEPTVKQVWNQVRRYASGSSWIGPDRADPQALRLQTEVVRPLRELLRKKPIYQVLHADAAEYFLDRAAPEGPRTAEFLREAVFHRFQFEGEAASRWWEQQIRTAAGPVARRALAEELVREPEYEDRERRQGPGDFAGPLVSAQTLRQAQLEFCLASAELAALRAPMQPQHPLWQDASDALERLESSSVEALSPGRLALARAAVALGARKPVTITPNLGVVLESPDLSPRDRLWLAVLYAYRLVAQGSSGSDAMLQIASRLEQDAMEERDVRRMLALGLVQRLRQRGQLCEAIEACMTAIDDRLGADTEFHLQAAAMRLASGDAATALSVAAEIAEDGSSHGPRAQVLLARCWRRQRHFGAALASAQGALALLEQSTEASSEASSAATWARGDAVLESGDIAAVLLRVGDARTAYADAARLFGEAGDPEAIARCHLREAVLLLTGLGNLRATGVALDNADRAAPEAGSSALHSQLTRAELASRLGTHTVAATILDQVERNDQRADLPPRMAATAVAGLAFGRRRDRDRYTGRLADSLGQITPPTARLQLLSRAIRCPELKAQAKAVKKLREAVIPPGGWDAEFDGYAPRDRPALRIRAAAFARLVGDRDDACEMLRAALRDIRGEEEPLAGLLEALRLARQLRVTDIITEAGQAAMASAQRSAEEYPLLAAAAVIEYLEAGLEPAIRSAEDPAAACARAEAWLDHGGLSAEAWRARLAELHATTQHTDSATVASYLEAAVRLYNTAGDAQQAEKVQARVVGPGPRLAPARPKVAVDLSLSQGEVKGKVDGWRLRLLPHRRKVTSGPLRRAITEWEYGPGTEPYPPGLPEMMVSEWSSLKAALAELLDAAELTVRLRRHADQADLAIHIKDGALQSLPWELAASRKGPDAPLFAGFLRAYRESAHDAPDTRLVRLVQAGLNVSGSSLEVDGVSGPDTAKALRAHYDGPDTAPVRADDPETVQRLHQARLQGARPGVIVIRPAPAEGRRPSLAVERGYAHVGFDAYTVDQTQISTLARLLGTEPPAVMVHIVGGLVARVGVTAIDLQEDGLLTAADLDHAFRAVPRDWPAPVVVLDVPGPTGQREVADQMLLRNRLAADLFAMGGTRAVVATGLADRAAAELVRDVLLEGLAGGHAIGDVVQRMRQQAPPASFDQFDSSAAFAGTALWSNDPSMRLPTLGGT